MEGSIPDLRDVLDPPIEETSSPTKFNSIDSMKDLLDAVDTNTQIIHLINLGQN